MVTFLFISLFSFYAGSFFVYLMMGWDRPLKGPKADLLFEIGFLIHTFLIFAEAKEEHIYLPITTIKEVLVFFSWSLAFVYVFLMRRVRHEMFGLVLLPFLLIFLSAAWFMTSGKAIPPDYFNNHYFLIHILSACFGYASFAISFAGASLYLAQSHALKSKQVGNFYRKLPPLKDLEGFIFYSVVWGIFLLGIAIVSGGFWSKSTFDTFFVWEPKTISSVLTWIIYVFVFYLHHSSLIGERRSVKFVLFAFAFVLFTFLGTSFMKTKLHVGI